LLQQPVNFLKGVGPERAALLARLDIRTVEDLLLHRPRRYEDRRHFRAIAELDLHQAALVRGTIVAMGTKYFRQRTRSIFEIVLEDGTGRLHCCWWNLQFMEKYFKRGDQVVVFGKPKNLRPRTMDHPETEVIEGGEEEFVHFNRVTPVYPLTEGITQRWLRGLIWKTLPQVLPEINEPHPGLVAEFPPGHRLPSRQEAIHSLHFPEEPRQAETALRRLALDEFLDLQILIQTRRRNFESKAKALPCGGNNRLIKPFLAQLGFKLTEDQARVLREMRADLSGVHPMRRLLQGDVGAGKTVVAACCALMVIESGYHVAIMAPTEILAEQHYRNFSRWLEPQGIPVELRTGSFKTTRPSDPEGPPGITIGTHALLTEGFEMPRLGLVVIDEQHKFGVSQREQLLRKGVYPHLLVMTATPIPRTLGLTLYGDLDVSVIPGLPPGRGRLSTFVRSPEHLAKVWEFIRSRLKEGRQAYVVYPRVEESDQLVKAVKKEFDAVQKEVQPYRAALLHGQMKAADKDQAMADFRANHIQALVATSLIEVGVDVPNATVMLIDNANSFGLAQLHQLRGRIGRGSHDSHCILVARAKTPEGNQRLKILEESNDGFKIAEADMQLRGPGELLGQQQSGMAPLRFGNLVTDAPLILCAREMAKNLHSVAQP
jgi:ATP-dependent DNA helicase RecG